MAISQFGTLPFGFFCEIWTEGINTYPCLATFEICQFITIPGPFEYFFEKKKKRLSGNQFS